MPAHAEMGRTLMPSAGEQLRPPEATVGSATRADARSRDVSVLKGGRSLTQGVVEELAREMQRWVQLGRAARHPERPFVEED